MLPYINLFGIKIPGYGLMILTAYIVAGYYLTKRSKYVGLDKRIVSDIIFYTVIGGFIGGKILYFITFFNYFGSSFTERLINMFSLNNLRSGFVFYGGLIGGVAAFYFYIRKHKLDFLKVADFFAPAAALAHGFGRIGCFLAGCCHGRPTNSIFGVVFSNPYCDVSSELIGVKIHSTQLYESLGNFIIFIILHFTYNRMKKEGKENKGFVVLLYLFLYSVLRFTVEFFRGDNRGSYILGFSQAQIISLVIISSVIAVYLMFNKKWKTEK